MSKKSPRWRCASFVALILGGSTAACSSPAENYDPGAYSRWTRQATPRLIEKKEPELDGWYAGVAIGLTDGEQDDRDLEDDLAAIGNHSVDVDLDDGGLGVRVFGLYRFLEYFGVELGFTSLEAHDSTINEQLPTSPGLLANVERVHPIAGYGVTLAAQAFTPEWNRISLHGRAGGWYWHAKVDVDINLQGSGPASTTIDESGFDFFGGLGAQVRADDHLFFRADWERYFLDGDYVDLFTLGFMYGF